MRYTSSLTQKGHVTIPQEIRRYLKLKPADKVLFIKHKDSVILKPSRSFLDLERSVKCKVQYSDILADKQVARYVSAENKETSYSRY